MHYPIYRSNLTVLAIVATTIFVASLVLLLAYTPPAVAVHTCSGANVIQVNPGDDLDAVVNADPPATATTFCVHGGTYTIDQTVLLNSGDQIKGEPGELYSVGPANRPEPVVEVTPGDNPVGRLIQAEGSNIRVVWLDLYGAKGRYSPEGEPSAGTGSAIAAGNAGKNFLARYVRVHNNEGAGITNMRGRVLDSEFFSNTENEDFLGFIGSAIKGIHEFEAARNFVHDEQGNGIWFDLGRDDPARTNGYWVHHNLVTGIARSGIRYENSPPGLAPGVHVTQPTALIENNAVYANSYGAPLAPRPISVRNSQNAVVRANVFGGATIDGIVYPPNSENVSIRAADAGRVSKTDMWNVDIVDNELNGDAIVLSTKKGEVLACGDLPEEMVRCANNSP